MADSPGSDRTGHLLAAVGHDEQGAIAAVEKAAAIARAHQLPLELFFCNAECAYALERQYERQATHEARARCLAAARGFLARLCEAVHLSGLQVSLDIACETPEYEAITRKVMQSKPLLVVRNMGSRLPNTWGSPDDTDWELVRTCPAPLLLTRTRPWRLPVHAIAAVDLSDDEVSSLERDIITQAQFLAGKRQDAVDVVYGDSVPHRELQKKEASLHALAASAGIPPAHVTVLKGDPRRILSAHAQEQNCDVIVLGALTRRSAFTSLVGSLTGRLPEAVSCDFLVLKPQDFACGVAAHATPLQAPRAASQARSSTD